MARPGGVIGVTKPALQDVTDATDEEYLAERFEADRPHLRRVAYRMLGSLAEAEDAVQESWLRLDARRHQHGGIT